MKINDMKVKLQALWSKYTVPTSIISIPSVDTGYDNRSIP
jgi:hypothetical protein